MSQYKYAEIADTVYFWFAANTTAGTAGDGATPLYMVRLAGAASGAAATATGTPTLLTHADYKDGVHEIAIDTTGHSAGEYAVFCSLTISTVNPSGFCGSYKLRTAGTAALAVDAIAISGDTTAANNAESFFDGTGYAGTNNVIPTVTTTTTATNVTTVNGLAAGVITAASIAADAITDAKVASDVTIASVTGAVGSVTGAVGSVTAGVTVTTNNDKTGYALTSGERNSTADAILDRDMSTGTDSGSSTVRTVRQALRALRNKWGFPAGVYTVYKEDDATSSWTGAVTTDAAAIPVTGNDQTGP
jgi:hypothetical protein